MSNYTITNKQNSTLNLAPLTDINGSILTLRPKGLPGASRKVSAETAEHEIIMRVRNARWIDVEVVTPPVKKEATPPPTPAPKTAAPVATPTPPPAPSPAPTTFAAAPPTPRPIPAAVLTPNAPEPPKAKENGYKNAHTRRP